MDVEFTMLIEKYKMDERQILVLKLCLLWEKLTQEIFPDHKHCKITKNGDPRKSHLFRICWKLFKETKNLLNEDEYSLYIRANLELLKNINKVTENVRIDPQILIGNKAWVRWRMWKEKFNQVDRKIQIRGAENIHASNFQIAQELQRTCNFLETQFKKYPSYEEFLAAKKDNLIEEWVRLLKISPYYLLLSPFCYKAFGGTKQIISHFTKIDLIIYKNELNRETLETSKKILKKEFT